MKVCWMTFLPINGWAAEALKTKLMRDGKESIAMVFIKPDQDLPPVKEYVLVEDLNRDFDLVAFMIKPGLVEAVRNFKIKNFKNDGQKFAQWLCPDFYDDGHKVRWCRVG